MSWTVRRFFVSFQPYHKPYFPLLSPLQRYKLTPSFIKNLFSTSMDYPPPPPPSLLILHGKSPMETKFAQSLKSNDTLKLPIDDGEVPIFLQSFKSSQIVIKEEAFDVEFYMNSLSTRQFGRFLIWSPRLSSTQDLVSKNFKEIPVGSVCIADVQFKGRGRSKNPWDSPKGCLLFSFTLQMEDGRIVPLLQYVVCLAIVEAIKDVCAKKGFPYIDVRIKWPNDLYLSGAKVGGILCTSTYSSKKFNVSVGIGLNVDNELPTTCLNKVLGELCETSYTFKREEILVAFFKRFEDLYEVFINRGFQALEEMYYRAWLHGDQRVVIQEKNEDGLVEEVDVTIQGLTSSGYLLAIDDENQMYELHPDGNSFDFFKGLVRKKLE